MVPYLEFLFSRVTADGLSAFNLSRSERSAMGTTGNMLATMCSRLIDEASTR